MMESTADRAATTHMLCCNCGIYFSAAASSENDQGSMNLDSNTASLACMRPSRVARHPAQHGMADMRLHVRDHLSGIGLIPAAIEILCHCTKLHEKVAGQIRRFGLAALFAPEPKQRLFILAHDDPGIGATHEAAPSSSALLPFPTDYVMQSLRLIDMGHWTCRQKH